MKQYHYFSDNEYFWAETILKTVGKDNQGRFIYEVEVRLSGGVAGLVVNAQPIIVLAKEDDNLGTVTLPAIDVTLDMTGQGSETWTYPSPYFTLHATVSPMPNP